MIDLLPMVRAADARRAFRREWTIAIGLGLITVVVVVARLTEVLS